MWKSGVDTPSSNWGSLDPFMNAVSRPAFRFQGAEIDGDGIIVLRFQSCSKYLVEYCCREGIAHGESASAYGLLQENPQTQLSERCTAHRSILLRQKHLPLAIYRLFSILQESIRTKIIVRVSKRMNHIGDLTPLQPVPSFNLANTGDLAIDFVALHAV